MSELATRVGDYVFSQCGPGILKRRNGRTAFAGPRHTSRMVPKRNAGAVGTSAPAVCLTIEGQGPSLELLHRLNTSRASASPHTQIQSGSTCPKGEPTIVINVGPVSWYAWNRATVSVEKTTTRFSANYDNSYSHAWAWAWGVGLARPLTHTVCPAWHQLESRMAANLRFGKASRSVRREYFSIPSRIH